MQPITLYTGPTPNGRKVSIALEEMELPYEARYVDILDGDQLKPEFLALNPNNKFPVIIDPDGPEGRSFTLWESGAILWYLAEKTGRFLPTSGEARHRVNQWLMFQMSGVGPMFGQFAHFNFYAKEKHPYSIERYGNEIQRQLRVMDGHLASSTWFAGDDYTIADISILPWVEGAAASVPDLAALQRWVSAMTDRDAVQRGLDVAREKVRAEIVEGGLKGLNDEHRSALFGDAQYRPR
ncbi:MAG: glutathione S-transferase N-terminal domain-containing protein [Pseudomonadaceae bacterium]|nr:glutathione S-transferase N-terminal domain-containing protein [Pseudomonadaceae bacterium]